MDDLFRETILEHYRNPSCQGSIENPDLAYEDFNPLCGDRVRMEFRIVDDKIAEVRWNGHGCSISQAAASMLCERIEGRPLDEVKAIDRDEVMEMLGIELGPVRLKCALLSLKTMKAGLYGMTTDEEDD